LVREQVIDAYELTVNDIVIDVSIMQGEDEPVPIYNISITNISETTKIILEKIREEFVESATKAFEKESTIQSIQDEFRERILVLLKKYFPRVEIARIGLNITNGTRWFTSLVAICTKQ